MERGDEIDEDLLNALLLIFTTALPGSGLAGQTTVNTDEGEIHYRNAQGTGWVRVQWGTNALQDGLVTESKYADDSVSRRAIAADAVGEDEVEDATLTGAKMVENTVGTREINDEGVERTNLSSQLQIDIPADLEGTVEDFSILNISIYS